MSIDTRTAELRAAMAKMRMDTDNAKKFFAERIAETEQEITRLEELTKKERNRDRKVLRALYAMQLASDVLEMKTTSRFLEEFTTLSNLGIETSIEVMNLSTKVPDMEKVKDETTHNVETALAGLQSVIDEAKKRVQEQKPRPAPEGLYT